MTWPFSPTGSQSRTSNFCLSLEGRQSLRCPLCLLFWGSGEKEEGLLFRVLELKELFSLSRCWTFDPVAWRFLPQSPLLCSREPQVCVLEVSSLSSLFVWLCPPWLGGGEGTRFYISFNEVVAVTRVNHTLSCGACMCSVAVMCCPGACQGRTLGYSAPERADWGVTNTPPTS